MNNESIQRGIYYSTFFYYECLTVTTRVPLTVNISVQRLNIDGALGILGSVMSLFEQIDNFILSYVNIFKCLILLFFFN